jgi:hypothetical protein
MKRSNTSDINNSRKKLKMTESESCSESEMESETESDWKPDDSCSENCSELTKDEESEHCSELNEESGPKQSNILSGNVFNITVDMSNSVYEGPEEFEEEDEEEEDDCEENKNNDQDFLSSEEALKFIKEYHSKHAFIFKKGVAMIQIKINKI